MIALLRGRVASIAHDHLVLDVHGVGYQVFASEPLLDRAEGEMTLHIATIVRQDAFLLYGFETAEDRDVFNLLRTVDKVGPAIAQGVVGHLGVDRLCDAVAGEDIAMLCTVPRVGRKVGERICLELKTKLRTARRPLPGRPVLVAEDPLVLALARLEYKKSEIDRALDHDSVPGPTEAPMEDRVRAALSVLARHA